MFIYYGHKFIITKLINNTGNTLHRVINSDGYKANKALRRDVKYFHCIALRILDYTKNISNFADLNEIFYAMYQVLDVLTKSFMRKLMTRFQFHSKYTFLLEQHKKIKFEQQILP
jgi:hypothetical protein